MDCNLYHIESVCFLYMDIGLDASSSSRMFYLEWNSPKGVARGVLGCPWPPLLQAFFNKTTYNMWRKCHDDILAIVTIRWVPSLWHSVTPPPFEKSWLRPWVLTRSLTHGSTLNFAERFQSGNYTNLDTVTFNIIVFLRSLQFPRTKRSNTLINFLFGFLPSLP